MHCIWQNLSHDLHAQIIAQIQDFKFWCNSRFVSRKWLELILENQDKKVWCFVKFRDNAFRLPNDVIHGIREFENYVYLYKFGKPIGAIYDENHFKILRAYISDFKFDYNYIEYIKYKDYIYIDFNIRRYGYVISYGISFTIYEDKIICNYYNKNIEKNITTLLMH
jgi:hypothetical protein